MFGRSCDVAHIFYVRNRIVRNFTEFANTSEHRPQRPELANEYAGKNKNFCWTKQKAANNKRTHATRQHINNNSEPRVKCLISLFNDYLVFKRTPVYAFEHIAPYQSFSCWLCLFYAIAPVILIWGGKKLRTFRVKWKCLLVRYEFELFNYFDIMSTKMFCARPLMLSKAARFELGPAN